MQLVNSHWPLFLYLVACVANQDDTTVVPCLVESLFNINSEHGAIGGFRDKVPDSPDTNSASGVEQIFELHLEVDTAGHEPVVVNLLCR